jgi:hypothetical protein
MKTRAIIEFKDTYASMECQELGYQTKETALAIISPTGQILSSTPLFKKAYGSNTAHIDQLPFTIDTLNITAKGLSEKVRANLEDWIAHTIILPMDYDKYFTKHQALLHLLAESPIVESVQSLTYKTVKIYFQKHLTTNTFANFKALFFLRQVSTATLVLLQYQIEMLIKHLNGPN